MHGLFKTACVSISHDRSACSPQLTLFPGVFLGAFYPALMEPSASRHLQSFTLCQALGWAPRSLPPEAPIWGGEQTGSRSQSYLVTRMLQV